MRLAAQMRGGFYPAPPEAVAHAATFLRPPPSGLFAIGDPCAGQGAAIQQLGALLGCPQSMIYAIELDDSRLEHLRRNLPEAHVLAPASFFGCRATPNSFSLIWLNPPFDDAYGGRRVEDEFLRNATGWLVPGGVLAFVCPENVASQPDICRHLAIYYECGSVTPFPAACRQFNEVIVFARKRTRPQLDKWTSTSWENAQAPRGFIYNIPSGAGPRFFQKVAPTETELQSMLRDSPLRSHLAAAPVASLSAPPLPLGMGHVALLLASGHLDGVVQPEGKPPHVVRGTSRKREFISDVTESENDDGTTTTRTTLSERIELVVRTIDLTGQIQTFMDTDAEADVASARPKPKP